MTHHEALRRSGYKLRATTTNHLHADSYSHSHTALTTGWPDGPDRDPIPQIGS